MFRICLGNFLEFRWILTSILGFEILSLFWQLFLTRMHLRIIANGTSQSVFITLIILVTHYTSAVLLLEHTQKVNQYFKWLIKFHKSWPLCPSNVE